VTGGYRYDAFVCSNPDRTVGVHDLDCTGRVRVGVYWNSVTTGC
jgi:hypothetical protein